MTARELQLLLFKTLIEAHNEYIIHGNDMRLTHIQALSFDFARVTLPYTVCDDAEDYLQMIAESLATLMDCMIAYFEIEEGDFDSEFQIGYLEGQAYLNKLLPPGAEPYSANITILTLDLDEMAEGTTPEGIMAYNELNTTDHLYTKNLMAMVNARMLRYVEEHGPSPDPNIAFDLMTEVCCAFLVGNILQEERARSAIHFIWEWFFVKESTLTKEEYADFHNRLESALEKAVKESKDDAA
jgi:hypothetical protein